MEEEIVLPKGDSLLNPSSVLWRQISITWLSKNITELFFLLSSNSLSSLPQHRRKFSRPLKQLWGWGTQNYDCRTVNTEIMKSDSQYFWHLLFASLSLPSPWLKQTTFPEVFYLFLWCWDKSRGFRHGKCAILISERRLSTSVDMEDFCRNHLLI